MEKQRKPANAWWAYSYHIAMWFLSGGLMVMGMASVESQDWALVGIGFGGATFLAWGAWSLARQVGYHKAIHEAYMEDERKRHGQHQEH